MILHARLILMIALGILIPSVHAEAAVPVVDASTGSGQQAAKPVARQMPNRAVQNSASPASLLYQLELLQQEVQTLRGIIEQQAHQMNQMREEQRDRYMDLDRRIGLLSQPGRSAPAVTQQPPTGTPGVVGEPSPPSRPGLNEKSEYQSAFDLIRNKRYDDAINAFAQFVKDFPNGSYTGNAYYWLGEVQVVKGNHQDALKAFATLLDRYPQHRKIPDAKYKLGKVYRELGDNAKAKQLLQEVVDRHSGTSAAKLAEAELRNLSL